MVRHFLYRGGMKAAINNPRSWKREIGRLDEGSGYHGESVPTDVNDVFCWLCMFLCLKF